MIKRFATSVVAVMVLCFLALPAFSATTVFSHTWNFDASDAFLPNPNFHRFGVGLEGPTQYAASTTNWTSQDLSTTQGLLGPFGNSDSGTTNPLASFARGVYVTIGTPMGATFNSVTISFQLWAINSWNGNSTTAGPDHFQVGVSSGGFSNFAPPTTACSTGAGSTSVACPTVANAGWTGSATPTTVVAPADKGFFTDPAINQQSMAANGFSIFDFTFTVPVTTINNQVTIWLAGWQNEGTFNESWALSNFTVTALSGENGGGGPGGPGGPGGEIPEPSTLALGGLGLALIALARRKSAKA
ncbi:MAG: PEP-CTERM sorting domain-containing protein [Bryobacterales bacterium]|jgi:hypothetical protein|nr:PEP-CTERM sorting domain-containing protein [Bryobacterales bacterium]